MTTEEKNTALYEKMSAEQDAFREQLKRLPPENILNHAYEYTIREDIVMAMEDKALDDAQADVLLAMEKPLSTVYNGFQKTDFSYMEIISDCISECADSELRIEQERRDALRNLPLYPYPGNYAREHGELEQYRASRQANVACRDAIDRAISENYHDNCLNGKAAVAQVAEVFGYERMLHICACTVRDKEWDGRISQDNIRWAHTFPIFEDKDGFGFDRRVDYLVDRSHPGLFDLFVKAARKEYLLAQERPSVLAKLQKPPAKNSPKHSANFRKEAER